MILFRNGSLSPLSLCTTGRQWLCKLENQIWRGMYNGVNKKLPWKYDYLFPASSLNYLKELSFKFGEEIIFFVVVNFHSYFYRRRNGLGQRQTKGSTKDMWLCVPLSPKMKKDGRVHLAVRTGLSLVKYSWEDYRHCYLLQLPPELIGAQHTPPTAD